MKHPRRAIVIEDLANTKQSSVICAFFREILEDELEEMGVHAKIRRSQRGDAHELVLSFHDYGVVTMDDEKLSGSPEWFEKRKIEAKGLLAAMRRSIKERVSREP